MINIVNKKFSFTLFINLLLFFIFSSAALDRSEAATPAENLLKSANSRRETLLQSSKRMNYRHNWMECIQAYEKIYTSYPGTDQAAWALFHSAGMYLGLKKISNLEKDLDDSLLLYERIIKEFPEHSLADDAQYKRGEIYYNHKQDMTQAYVEFLKVEIKYPNGDMRPATKVMLEKLSSLLGEKQVNAEKTDTVTDTAESSLTTVTDIRYWSTPSYTRIVIDLDKPAEYEDHLLKKDPALDASRRLYLDIKNTRVGKDIETTIPIKDGLLKTARAGQYSPDTVRVVLDIDSISGYKTFRLHDPFRIVIDVQGNNRIASSGIEKKSQKRQAGKGIIKPKKPDESVSLARQLGLTVKRIVLDPGHGGKDPGCFFDGGIKEKDIVLAIAKKLKLKIEKRLSCEVLLTRTTDIFIPLDERTAFANIKKADLFISLHVNAHREPGIFGIETYFLNMTTDKQAVLVAARENATSEKNISDLQSILNDLMLNTKISESNRLAHSVQDGIMRDLRKKYQANKSLGVKQAPFYVLIGAEMPAILIETGFITNSTDRKKLIGDNYKDVVSEGISRGVEDYIKSIDMAYTGG